MAFEAGVIVGRLTLDSSKFRSSLQASHKDAKKFGNLIEKNNAKIKALSRGMVIAGAAIIGGLAMMTKKASDFEEASAKFGTVFQDVTADASASIKDLTENYGLSTLAATDMLSATGDLLVGLGMQGKVALSLSERTQKLAIDLASFTNFSGGAKGASDALTKAMLGERESVKALGIVITEEMVKEQLLKEGKERLTGMARLQAKAEATLTIAISQSTSAMGDYERTKGSLANVSRRLTARLEDLWVVLGTKLIPITTKYAEKITKIVEKTVEWVEVHPKLTSVLTKSTAILGGMLLALGGIGMALPKIAGGLKAVKKVAGVMLGPLGGVAAAIIAIALAAGWAANKLINAYQKRADAEMDALVEGAKGARQFHDFRRKLIEDEIVTVEEWAGIYEKHGRDYRRVMVAISKLPEYEHIRKKLEELKKAQEEAGEPPPGILEASKEYISLISKMFDEVKKGTLDEFKYRVWAAEQTYEERKALLEKEKADKQAFALLEKAYAVELGQIEKDRTQEIQEEAEKRANILRTALEKQATIERAYREKVRSIALAAADIEKQLTLDEFDYERDKLNEKYATDLIAAEGNSEAMLQIIRAYQLQKAEIDEEEAESKKVTFEMIGEALMMALGQSKAGAVAQAIMSTYAGAAKTIEMLGMPLAIPFVAMAIIQGFKQVRKIMAVDIPSAEAGAYLPSPAIIEAGHGPMGEVILPLDKAPGMGMQKIIIQNRITIGEQTFYKESVKSINLAGEKRDLKVPIAVVIP